MEPQPTKRKHEDDSSDELDEESSGESSPSPSQTMVGEPARKRREAYSVRAAQETGGASSSSSQPGTSSQFLVDDFLFSDEKNLKPSDQPSTSDLGFLDTLDTVGQEASSSAGPSSGLDPYCPDELQDESARPAVEPSAQGDCFFMTAENKWQKAKFLLTGTDAQFRYSEKAKGRVFTKIVNLASYNKDVVGVMNEDWSIKQFNCLWPVPKGCHNDRFVMFPGDAQTPTLRLQFAKPLFLVDFYEYWKAHVCPAELHKPESSLYERMKIRTMNEQTALTIMRK